MSEHQALSLVAGLMVLVLVVGGLARRRFPKAEAARIGLIWAAILIGATILVTLVRRFLI